jgi:hypothetical protein
MNYIFKHAKFEDLFRHPRGDIEKQMANEFNAQGKGQS